MLVQLDYFPAVVETPGGQHDKVRVIVTDKRAVVFAITRHGPEVTAHVEATGVVDTVHGMPLRVPTSEGTWLVSHAQGCGCGSMLKAIGRDALLAHAGVTG